MTPKSYAEKLTKQSEKNLKHGTLHQLPATAARSLRWLIRPYACSFINETASRKSDESWRLGTPHRAKMQACRSLHQTPWNVNQYILSDLNTGSHDNSLCINTDGGVEHSDRHEDTGIGAATAGKTNTDRCKRGTRTRQAGPAQPTRLMKNESNDR
ncbi:unnamed protein product [Dibothriocephalus latus]|uniref:Uncharacterized protein n=1 Tax=Dibothriocephalus latus TaxID=60516 RepID=A0A3P7MA91_DIBLA|nr:unnamed protein product [Dibothriocephalus latus]